MKAEIRFSNAFLGKGFVTHFSLEFHNKELKSITREKLFGWCTELDLSVYLVGHVWLPGSPLFAEAAFQGHPLHVL